MPVLAALPLLFSRAGVLVNSFLISMLCREGFGRGRRQLESVACAPGSGLEPSGVSATPRRKLHSALFKMPVRRCLSERVS
jgi:hypothetical protein